MESFAVITQATGNLLHADTVALVNTVNTVGVMGKGIALQFRRAYPQMFEEYQKACARGQVQIGRMHVWETGMLEGPRYIINFPTKRHWRAGSKLEDVRAGLTALVAVIRDLDIESIAIPPLGCGNGGLEWSEVEPLLVSALSPLPDLDARIYPPVGTPPAGEMPNATPRPDMTVGRAALVELLTRYLRNALEATPLEIQKLMYFLQVVGEPLGLEFTKGRYGPYADSLRRVLNLVEGHFLTGYGDGSARTLEASSVRPLPGAAEQAARVLADEPATRQRIALVDNITDGFESMYGMELLATVHWLTVHDVGAAETWQRTAELVREWTPRKAEMFTDDHVRTAWNRLRDHDLVSPTTTIDSVLHDEGEISSARMVVSERVSRNELGSRLVEAITDSGYAWTEIAVITATLDEAEYLQQVLDYASIPTLSLEKFDGTPQNAVKVGTVRRAKGVEFAAVFHPTLLVGSAGADAGDGQATAELAARQAWVAMTRARDYLWVGLIEE
ncbi:type II toxin-antitoxin system antitoxin DNA ADP-ribosyl glycohydrolase DarG [Nocardia acidivorans]|uniref:type II toxin-antitoxin system antitoxin DNA ADP-ribosyl glycohydrolase DarG n=1 Tax=Nocardia acidivorans TaxID=404580 RepID=UPI000830EC86|nr:macro domain-containing protein [Nocardia acidivorans]